MRDEIEEWIDHHSDFAHAIKIAEAKHMARLERLREVALLDKSKRVNLKLFDFILKDRFVVTAHSLRSEFAWGKTQRS